MRHTVRLIPACAAIVLAGILSSCGDDQARLAKDMTGVWQGTPETFSDQTAITATTLDSYEFTAPSRTATGQLTGSLTVTGMVNATTQVVSDSTMVEPTDLSISGRTSISGTWTVVDDDEVAISFDTNTLTVSLDTAAVATGQSPLAQLADPRIDSLRPALAGTITRGIQQALRTRYASINHWDDIKVKGPLLKYECRDEDFVLTRDTSATH